MLAGTRTPGDDILENGPAATVITPVVFNNVVPRHCNPNDVSPNFDLDEEDEAQTEDLDDVEEVDVSCNINGKITVTGNGIQQRYVEGIQI